MICHGEAPFVWSGEAIAANGVDKTVPNSDSFVQITLDSANHL
jgi:hypothetical protein